MAKYIIEGGLPLKGSVRIPGAKNAGFKLMIACLLSDERSTISNVPYIRDVVAVKRIIEAIGPKAEISDDTIEISGPVRSFEIPQELGLKSRASFMYLPVLVHRFKKAIVPFPVGDQIGQRPINWFLEALEKMGATIKVENSTISATAFNGLAGINYSFPKNTHTGTESLLMAATLASGQTIIENAAAEPEVDDLISFLNQMGSKIGRVSERTIKIQGVNSLKGAVHRVMPDRNEVATFSCLALGTKGNIEIDGAEINHVRALEKEIISSGGGWEASGNKLRVYYNGELKPTDVATSPYPGFMTDWQSLWVALMTQAQGTSSFHETIFENRFGYVPSLQKMGAKIELFSPQVSDPEKFYNFELNEEVKRFHHAVKIFGPTALKSGKLEISDIRAGATMVFAALTAKGQSEIFGIEHLERGYEDLEARLEKLGAKISRME